MGGKVKYIFIILATSISFCALGINVGTSLQQSTKKPDYSDVYDKIDETDIFRHVRRIMRNGDAANGVPRMVPFSRIIQFTSQNDLGDTENQRIDGLDQFITKSSLIYANNLKLDFALLWPRIIFSSTHTSQNDTRIFYSNYTFIGCNMKGEADIESVNYEGCYKIKKLRISLHFKRYEINVVTSSTADRDQETAHIAKQTFDRYIKQEYTLGLERQAYELEKSIIDYFGNYRCIIEDQNDKFFF